MNENRVTMTDAILKILNEYESGKVSEIKFTIDTQLINKTVDKLKEENENLKKIIAKELSENDEFGAEFVHVNILKEKLKIAVDDLKKLEAENSALLKQLNKIQEAITVSVTLQG